MVGGLIITLVIGGVAGWLAGLIVKGYGFGVIGNVIVGIVGAFLAGLILPRIGLTFGDNAILANLIYAVIGSVILLWLLRFIRKTV